jgi:DNA-directed RNA polymerase specialized sigma24 family protein
MGISQKAVYKRINRILRKCRSELKKRGISFHDLL